MSEVITNIGELTTNTDRGRLVDAAIVLEGGRVAWIGSARDAPAADTRTDAEGRALLPGWVDIHTHTVFAGDRAAEFESRMAGTPYSAGGIGTTVAATRAATDENLLRAALRIRDEAERQGTTFLETKTGYGLDAPSERRLAQVSRQVADTVTFLGAHVVPQGVDRRDYVRLVCGQMLAEVRPFVDAMDVFCEEGAFTVEESREILLAGRDAGLRLHVHGNQLGHSGGVALAVELGAASVDHCNHLSADDVEMLAASRTVATVLPACDLSTRQPLAPARRLLDAGAALAIATNCNPGSSFTTSMPYCIATAVLQMGLSVGEAVDAATRGAARALGRDTGEDAIGVVAVGARADLQLLEAPSVSHLAYRPGVPSLPAVWRGGVRVRRGSA
ncbi:imidazolonepropionase [Microbacterium sp. BR1]|uniref:imidazolonepropionase n=1 Tax=Microbacterium sp. BR1 TaxID=1070896 RepID=UPI000C2B7161|nr:imidazolonepropionase [Microbacterium sp. BR1]